MKYYNIKQSSMLSKIINNIKVIVAIMVLMPMTTTLFLLWHKSTYERINIDLSVLDYIIYSTTPWLFSLTVVFMCIYLLLHFVKYDYNVNLILKRKNKALIWFNQLIGIIGVSLFMSFYYFIVVFIIAKCQTNIICNWYSKSSVFFLNTKLVEEPNILKVITLFICTMAVVNMVLCSIVLLSKWLFNNYLPGWLIVIAMIWLDLSHVVKIPLLLNTITITYSPLLINESFSGVMIGLLILIILWIIGFVFSKEREFYDEV